MNMNIQNGDLSAVKGIGPKTVLRLGELGIFSIKDLTEFIPKAYKDRGVMRDISQAAAGERILTKAVLSGAAKNYYYGRTVKTVMKFTSGSTDFSAVFYNQPYRKNMTAGKEFILYGIVSAENGALVLISPQTEPADENEYLTEGLYSVYPLPAKSQINQRTLTKYIKNALSSTECEEDMPLWIINELDLAEKNKSLNMLHFPHSDYDLTYGMKYFMSRRFLKFQAFLSAEKLSEKSPAYVFSNTDTDEFSSLFGFKLTLPQKKAAEDIKKDLTSGLQMNRLLQGDVGSGKTAVAMISAYSAVLSGFQAAVCAPTEILARQHYEKYAQLFSSFGYECTVLYSSLNKKNRENALRMIKDGTARVIFGTHALFSDDVVFENLAFIVIDEQQRYGVSQRAALAAKGANPHMLVMSATPIPRTLMLSIYKDLDLSVISSGPSGRKKVATYLADPSMEGRIYDFIRKKAQSAEKSYIVCPAIDDEDLENVESVFEETKNKLDGIRTEKLTGEMKEEKKNSVMNSFAHGDCMVLVATSVIEVGIDVADAVLIWIKGSERFGLSQLHQLRGRVGRSEKQSWCILQTESSSPETVKRLNILCSVHDGFEIARQDLMMRGSGEIFGIRQSGKENTIIDDIMSYEELFGRTGEITDRLKKSVREEDAEFLNGLTSDTLGLNGNIILN